MSTYRAPLADMTFVMDELAGLSTVAQLPGFEEATPDTVAAILEEASKFASDVLDPLNASGDREGAKLIQREDDKETAVARRLAEYDAATAPLVEYYRRRSRFHDIDGYRPVDSVFGELKTIVEAGA
jgi:adenylate kinase family enzyme